MALSDLAVFNEWTYSTMTEILDQQIELFNAATRNALVLRSANHTGDYSETAMWAKITNLVRRRNAYGTGTLTAQAMKHLVDTSVKVAAGTNPIDLSPGQFKWIQLNPEEAGAAMGQQLAVDTMADMLNTGVMAVAAALSGVTDLVTDVHASPATATSTASLANLNTAVSKFGDRSQAIAAWVLHSKPLFDIYGQAIANSSRLFVFGNIAVAQDGFGRPLIMTDSPSLTAQSTDETPVTVYKTLGLVPGALLVDQNGDYTQNIDTRNGNENISSTFQAEWSYNAAVKGFSWDKTNGGKSPTNAALGTASNWDKYSTYEKDLAGVMLISN
jgi:hypothetical protein